MGSLHIVGYRRPGTPANLPVAMSEPQARSTLGTRWRTFRAALPPLAGRRALRALAWLTVSVSAIPSVAVSQIRGRAPQAVSTGRWWFSGGAAAPVLGNISDGPSRSLWQFGNDPLWQLRGTIERATDAYTSIGLAAAYGLVDLTVSPLSGTFNAAPQSALPTQCAVSCDANVQLWSLMGQFRSGGGAGFHTLFEATGGVTGFRNVRTRDSLATPIGKSSAGMDVSGALGPGFGYSLSNGFVIAVVQDFGIGWHTKTDLPSGTGRTWRVRTTRASLRFAF